MKGKSCRSGQPNFVSTPFHVVYGIPIHYMHQYIHNQHMETFDHHMEKTARIEIRCAVKGYQECHFMVDVGEEFFIHKKIGSQGRAFKLEVINIRGQLGHLERALVAPLWPFKDGMKW